MHTHKHTHFFGLLLVFDLQADDNIQVFQIFQRIRSHENERDTGLNAEFQRIAKRDKKAFLSDQCKEIEGNNRTGKTRGLFKKIRDSKGTLHAKMGSIKDRNCMYLTEEKDIKKRWQEYTELLYKKDLHEQDYDVITYLEPDILECEVKWALGA